VECAATWDGLRRALPRLEQGRHFETLQFVPADIAGAFQIFVDFLIEAYHEFQGSFDKILDVFELKVDDEVNYENNQHFLKEEDAFGILAVLYTGVHVFDAGGVALLFEHEDADDGQNLALLLLGLYDLCDFAEVGVVDEDLGDVVDFAGNHPFALPSRFVGDVEGYLHFEFAL
jgi:hypothetical protein